MWKATGMVLQVLSNTFMVIKPNPVSTNTTFKGEMWVDAALLETKT